MPAILFFQLEGDAEGQTLRVNADHIISYNGNEKGTVLMMQGAVKPIVVQQHIDITDAMFEAAGFKIIAHRVAF